METYASAILKKEKEMESGCTFYIMENGKRLILKVTTTILSAHPLTTGTLTLIEKLISRAHYLKHSDIFAQAANQTVQIASEVQSIKKGEKPFSNTSSNVNISENTNLSDDNISKERNPLQSLILYPQIKQNTDSRTYANYDGMLSKMRYGNMEYDDAKRKEYQSKMRALREKWEKRGERFQHSENEDWLGK